MTQQEIIEAISALTRVIEVNKFADGTGELVKTAKAKLLLLIKHLGVEAHNPPEKENPYAYTRQ